MVDLNIKIPIKGKFEIDRRIGKGSFGDIYRGKKKENIYKNKNLKKNK